MFFSECDSQMYILKDCVSSKCFWLPRVNNVDLLHSKITIPSQIKITGIQGRSHQFPDCNFSALQILIMQSDSKPPIPPDTLVERIEKVYICIEKIIMNEAQHFSNSGRAALRRAQAELQKIRLSLQDSPPEKPSDNELRG